jgi:two-component system KDP operon response regulator KdpE
MANIRRKIEENPAEPRYIVTQVGVGYRMMEELED